jgi:hypothetical protein
MFNFAHNYRQPSLFQMMNYEKKLPSYIWINTIYLAKSFPMKTWLCHLAHSMIIADAIVCYLHTGLGGRKTRQRERHMMKDFDITSTRENLVGLWSGKPLHLKGVLISAVAPAMTVGGQSANNATSSARMAFRKKHKTFVSASQKSISLPDKQIPRVRSVPTRSSSV